MLPVFPVEKISYRKAFCENSTKNFAEVFAKQKFLKQSGKIGNIL